MISRCLLLFLSLTLFSTPAFCGIEAKLEAQTQFEKTDAKLDRIYQELLALIPDKRTRDFLKEDQKAWVTFREKDATAMAGITSNGGSAFSFDYLANLLELTESRIKQFERKIDFYK